VAELLQILLKLQNTFNSITIEERKEFYYKARDNFNTLKKDTTSNVNDLKIASLFIFLNKTCFNGLYRVNNNGNFNVSMGAYKNPLICDKNNLIKCSRLLQNVIIECGSYENIISKIDSSTFIYIDPPYRPLSKTSSFVSYNKDGFTDIDQIKLSDNIHYLSKKGIKFIMSNSDPKNYNSNDNFFDELYKDFHIERISALRCINSNTALRNKISELLITNIN
jgi:DNA adenine methylase